MTRTSEHDGDAPDIARLVRGAAEGDRRAWEHLVEQYARLIWSITAEFKLIESDAADVAQTTMSRHRPSGLSWSPLRGRRPVPRPSGRERTAVPHPARPRRADSAGPCGCREPASAWLAWPARRQPPRAAVGGRRAPGTAARPPGMPRRTPEWCVRRIAAPSASHARP